jgi:alkylhydroperoxidase family enzyme
MTRAGYLAPPPPDDDADRVFAEDVAEVGYVMNASRIWAYNFEMLDGLFELMRTATSVPGMTSRQRAILVAATCSTLGDSYCSLAWGSRLAQASTARIAAGVIVGDDRNLTPQDAALASWARAVARDASQTTQADVQALRDVGYDDAQIFAITAFISFRIAFASVNDALGARPDAGLRDTAPQPVLRAVDFGRPIEDAPEHQPG